VLGIGDEVVHTGDHIAYFYSTDVEFDRAFDFFERGLEQGDHCLYFGIPEDIDRAMAVLKQRRHDVDELLSSGRLSILEPALTCDGTLERVSAHFEQVFGSGASFVRFLGNAAVGHDGWPSEEEFFKLEAAVSESTLTMPCVAICMFDLRAQPASTIMKAAFEGHPVTFHRNCIRENPYYIPRSMAGGS
jgi:two-component system, chemotaxis family, sensor kinase Cph1